MARAAENSRLYPTLVTAGIAAMLAIWGMFALAGAGLIARLPALKPMLILITTVYLLRGPLIVVLLTPARSKSTRFLVWSSVACLVYGVVHLIGLVQVWSRL